MKDQLKKSTEDMDTEIKFANITNEKLAYKTFGSGEPLVMCTGYSSNMDLWSTKLIDILCKKYQVIVFDYRGMGYSTNSSSSFTINDLATDLKELLDELKIKKTSLLGWSMGSFVAQMFAINYPEKLNKLILYAGNCGGSEAIEPNEEIVKILSSPSSTPMEFLSTLFPDEWLAAHSEPWKCLPEAKEPYNFQTIGLQYYAIEKWTSPGGGSAGKLGKLKMPVLVITGDNDKVVPLKNSSIIAELIEFSTLVIVKNSGHGLMYQMPETFANHILDFLTE
jgi:pimeloyl-ACP methyl ester carboxylesterase